MAALTAGLLAASVGSQYFNQRGQAQAAISQSNYESQLYAQNAAYAELQARDAIDQGDFAVGQRAADARVASGSIRAAGGASGVTGPADVYDAENQSAANADEIQLRANALRIAAGYKTEASQYRAQGELVRTAGQNTAASLRAASWGTLLTGAAQGYGMLDQVVRDAGGWRALGSKLKTRKGLVGF